jgi:hypothetical protein
MGAPAVAAAGVSHSAAGRTNPAAVAGSTRHAGCTGPLPRDACHTFAALGTDRVQARAVGGRDPLSDRSAVAGARLRVTHALVARSHVTAPGTSSQS